MVNNPQSYTLFLKFVETFASTGYKDIDRNQPLVKKLEEMTKSNKQYFFIADLLQGKILFTSNQSKKILGIEPEELTPYDAVEAVHPDEVYRNTNGWAKLLHMGSNLLAAKNGYSLLSVNMKMRNPRGLYPEILFQCYLFYSRIPHETVYDLQVHTDIDFFKKRKHGYHYYVGNDLSNFRYPDKELLNLGNVFSNREFEIIRLIKAGLSTEQIAEKLFLSAFTVNTHRRNIITKTGKKNISDLIYELKEQGVL